MVGLVRFIEFNVGQLYIYMKSGVVYVSCNTNLDHVDDAPFVIIKRQLCQSYNVTLVFDNVKLVVYLGSYIKMVDQVRFTTLG